MPINNISVFREKEHLKIKINGLLHLRLIFNDIIGIQAFKSSNTEWDPYKIEYRIRGESQSVLTGYTDKDDWINILKQLNNFP